MIEVRDILLATAFDIMSIELNSNDVYDYDCEQTPKLSQINNSQIDRMCSGRQHFWTVSFFISIRLIS